MKHEPKLTVYTIKLQKSRNSPYDSNRWLFRNKIGEANTNKLEESFIMTEIFRRFINELDTPAMFSEPNSKKCMTANQPDIDDECVNPNILLHSSSYIIEGKVEGGSYGRKRNKTSIINKADKSNVSEGDAITEDFYFLLYTPLSSNRSILILQSYTDDSIDSVMKKFWANFYSFPSVFKKPIIKRFIPKSIIEDFKENATVSNITFSTDVAGETLLDETISSRENLFKITVQITPINDNISMSEFENVIEPLQEKPVFLDRLKLGTFLRKKGVLKDRITEKKSPFELGTDFEIQPTIMLAKYIDFTDNENDFAKIKDYCFNILEEIKEELNIQNAVQER